MKNLTKYMMAAAMGCMAISGFAQLKQDWGDFKLWIDPGHSGRENAGMYNYTEAQKVLRVGLATREFLFKHTTASENTIQMTRDDDQDNVSLEERSDMANAWGADFFYSIHSDAGSGENTTLFLFGGWKKNGEYIEKTPTGGKRYGDILCPNLTGVMYKTGTRGNFYDRIYYNGDVATHDNQYPYLSVNRRTNMASLLSEGGFHTHPVQQGLNMNESYKRLEAFGTARSIMEFRGLTRPNDVLLAGVVTNSENGEAIDGVSVTVNGKTIVTDTYESLFKQYVRNAGIVHNGFFLFEDLTPGQEYEITYSCPGYAPKTQKVTMKSDPQGLSGDNVTWGNIELTSNAPAIVASNSVLDPTKVNTRNDIVLTFSRNMDRASVEQAFSITGVDPVELKWTNDHTLRIVINKLKEDRDYTITIDGAVAKNVETQQFLDGDADGQEGGNYKFEFTTIPADVEAPYITSTTPEEDATELYTMRPVIRVEYNEELAWNEDLAIDAIVVEDADGKKYEGRLTHEIVREASVLHLYLNEDLTRDMCYKVTVKGGFADLAGNISESKTFKFLSEYRTVKSSTPLIGEYNASEWFTPGGSGSSKGFTDMENQTMGKSCLV
ncbi:MAG: Ig-like domain-containing protein, partial [Bacteroidales bacterium]|nr:Ig-like domain-containing protein [Candidatus Sodaliphilus fimicaballi]